MNHSRSQRSIRVDVACGCVPNLVSTPLLSSFESILDLLVVCVAQQVVARFANGLKLYDVVFLDYISLAPVLVDGSPFQDLQC